jgi:hypothetical protein|tara:strand:+ start:847 stop:1164 length:318 start_codon:yes stop_codon:yes gene_type:complete
MTEFQQRRELIVCADNFKMSVQASKHHYCTPRKNGSSLSYSHVEVGFPTLKENLLMNYIDGPDEPTNTVYSYVPAYIIIHIINKHGGMVSGKLPDLDLTEYDEEE